MDAGLSRKWVIVSIFLGICRKIAREDQWFIDPLEVGVAGMITI